MDEKEIEDLVSDLQLAYGFDKDWLIKGSENKEIVGDIVRRHFKESNHRNKIVTLEAKLFVYEQIILKSNFAPMLAESKLSELSSAQNK